MELIGCSERSVGNYTEERSCRSRPGFDLRSIHPVAQSLRLTMLTCPITEMAVERNWRKLGAPYNFSRMLKEWQLSAVCCFRHREHRRC